MRITQLEERIAAREKAGNTALDDALSNAPPNGRGYGGVTDVVA